MARWCFDGEVVFIWRGGVLMARWCFDGEVVF